VGEDVTGDDGAGDDGAGDDGAGDDGAGEDGAGDDGAGEDGAGEDGAGDDGAGDDGAGDDGAGDDGIVELVMAGEASDDEVGVLLSVTCEVGVLLVVRLGLAVCDGDVVGLLGVSEEDTPLVTVPLTVAVAVAVLVGDGRTFGIDSQRDAGSSISTPPRRVTPWYWTECCPLLPCAKLSPKCMPG